MSVNPGNGAIALLFYSLSFPTSFDIVFLKEEGAKRGGKKEDVTTTTHLFLCVGLGRCRRSKSLKRLLLFVSSHFPSCFFLHPFFA